ncbi:MAG: ATP-dependent DNA helicase RecG [Alphaproteobacteria bacterium]|nr:ATP-dependent DNA helicase RecG [Alphaproteobacteria bacterium]
MRPEILFPLYASIDHLQGIGPEITKTLKRLGMKRVVDMIWHLPSGIAHFPLKQSLTGCRAGDSVACVVTIIAYEIPHKSQRQPFKIVCELENGDILIITYFKAYAHTIEKRLPVGEKRLVCGTLDRYLGLWQMPHPERVAPAEVAGYWQEKTPLYPLTAGLLQYQAQKFIHGALKRAPDLPEWIPPSFYKADWPSWRTALEKAHTPQQDRDLQPRHPARERLAFDELLADQLALGLVRRFHHRGKSIVSKGLLKEKILKGFGHALTPGQIQALKEIEADLALPKRMVRLLQGDVGSGKTLVALLAMVHGIEAGFQTALLVPTEILAAQHAQTLTKLCEGTGIEVALLTSRQKKKATLYEDLANGKITLVVGTHALLQDAVQFSNLGLAVIDEQHRFGVEQRLNLMNKGEAVDLLVMTATPIPRTLRLTAYGDLEVSRISDKPLGRKPIQTHVMGLNRLEEVCSGLKRQLDQGHKIYWVCPLVEESETLDLAAAKERYVHLTALFGEKKVGLVYGKQKNEEKESTMAAFKDGPCQILVATTVIEVGIDVKTANIMVIEHAERFGLAQLHQLRGRVGRGEEEAHCLLLYGFALSPIGKRRLEVMRETQDGFRIAEEDLILRGGGDVLGTKQSGLPSYRLADPLTVGPLLEKAHEAAQSLLERDPQLVSPEGKSARLLLSLFGQEEVIHTLVSG